MQKFYVVGTPIGNLEDITFRAVGILSTVDLILCEDTRITLKLLERYQITTPTLSYHVQSKLSKVENILKVIGEGKTLALISDAGTPTISDPGSLLVSKIRETFKDIDIIAIPGPSALSAGLSVSGLPASEFTFLGFLPHKKGREKLFTEIQNAKHTMVFYESPHRIMKTLTSLKEKLSEKRRVVIGRELTKVFEQVVSGTASEVLSYFEAHSDKVRGEFIVMISE